MYYAPGSFGALNQAVRQVSDFADRGQPLEDQIKAAQQQNTAAGQAAAQQLQHQPIPPPAFNVLFIGATGGDTLQEIATLLPYYMVSQPQVQFIGPALWADATAAMASSGVYNGALYAAPDPAAAGGVYRQIPERLWRAATGRRRGCLRRRGDRAGGGRRRRLWQRGADQPLRL